MIYAAILAGGVGKRIERHNIPKQFIDLAGTPIIVLTIREFLKNERFDAIYIAVNKDWKKYLCDIIEQDFSEEERKRLVVVEGGKERLDSFENVLNDIVLKNGVRDDDILICHDSVRPFVRQQMIDDSIDATFEDGFALTVVPTSDTIFTAENEKYIEGTLDRNVLYNGQTPSGFNVKLLKEALEKFSDEEKKKITGTTQLMLKLGYKLRIVKGHTSNFKITTDNDLDIADRMVMQRSKNRNISLLDCTLRDGGIVVDFNFGQERMQIIKNALEESGVEYIECGYIDEKKGSSCGRTCFDNEVSIEETLLSSGKKEGVVYCAMIDYGTFDVNKLKNRTPGGIDAVRLAFHKEKWQDAIESGKIIMQKGYDLFVQPMVSLRYSDEEFRTLINRCNNELSGYKGFYVVDSFGQMDGLNLQHKLEIADRYVAPGVVIGFHAHNNRQMAYSNALSFISYNTKHDTMLDSSIMGMGKGAGNLCTELIESDLIREGKNYNTNVIYDQISEYFANQQKVTPWGYSLDYYLSSLYSCTPSYIKIFTGDERVTTDILVELIKTIPEDKKAACDRTFASQHLEEYFRS